LITVVSGVPRSGTSLMMQMLAAGGMPILSDGVRAPDANNPRGYFEWEPAKQLFQEPASISCADAKAVKVISSLLLALPPTQTYRIIFLRRPLDEVVRSQEAMLETLGAKAALGVDRMAAALRAHLKQVETWLAQQSFLAVWPVEYHQLLSDPEGESKRIQEFLGMPLDIESMARQVDTRLYRSRARDPHAL